MKAGTGPLHTSKKQTYQTPENILALVRSFFGTIHLDPCTVSSNPTGALNIHTILDDGLAQDWTYNNIYINPPYNETKKWIEKGVAEKNEGNCNEVIYLLPSRTDTKWFNLAMDNFTGVCFIEGRLKFKGEKNSAPFPSLLLYFGDNYEDFYKIFTQIGRVYRCN